MLSVVYLYDNGKMLKNMILLSKHSFLTVNIHDKEFWLTTAFCCYQTYPGRSYGKLKKISNFYAKTETSCFYIFTKDTISIAFTIDWPIVDTFRLIIL